MNSYHDFVHLVAAWAGFIYDDSAPAWIHPILHLILVLAPAFLALVIVQKAGAALLTRGRAGHHRRRPRLRDHPAGFAPGIVAMVLRHGRLQQARMILLSLLAMPILYVTLELPKRIVNNALDSDRFPVTGYGVTLDQVQFLLLLCGLYLITILLNGFNKYALNVAKGDVAERFVRRLRLLIFRHWRRGDGAQDRSEIIPVLVQEVEPIGGFAADVLTLPILQGGTLITILLFMFVQDPLLGAAALTVLPVQLILLPRLQRRVNAHSRVRIKAVRKLGADLHNARLNTISATTLAGDFAALERIRKRLYRLKFFIKALNNFLTALTPFLFYALGGYLVIEGRMTLGALVAVLAAHKDFSAPLRDLFKYYQNLEDTRIRYHEIRSFLAPMHVGQGDPSPERQSPSAEQGRRHPMPHSYIMHRA